MLFNIIFEVLARTIRKEKETKRIRIENGVNIFLFVDDTIVYVRNTEAWTRTFLELMLSASSRYIIYIQNTWLSDMPTTNWVRKKSGKQSINNSFKK